jgi:hypothetical protein
MFLVFLYRVCTNDRHTWSRDSTYGLPWYKDWRSFAFAMFVSCIGVLVRIMLLLVHLSRS